VTIIYHHRTQGTGAEGVHIAYIIRGFRRLGHAVSVISPNDTDPTETAGSNPYAQRGSTRARVLHAVTRRVPQFLFEFIELLYNVPAYFKLNSALRAHPADMLYERHAFFLWVGAYLAKRHRCTYVVEVNEVAGEARVRRQLFTRLATLLERYVFARADAIIVVSEFIKRRIEALGVSGDRIHVIPNGVDESLFTPAVPGGHVRERLGIDPHAIVIGFIGWFVAWHNLERLVEGFARVARDADARLILVGDGVLKERLVESGRRLSVLDWMVFPGAVAYQHVPEYVSAMDICVIPGSNQYRSPIKLFEYMAMEKAVLAPRVEPIQQVVEDGVNAMLFDQDDDASLGRALMLLCRDRAERERLGKNARQTVVERHTWNLNAKRIIDVARLNHLG
jgi:glycosyltransferase involved in cell wall biosynthesis